VSQTPLQNPFVGLRPFESEDSLYYFGRDEQIKALLRQLHETRFLAVVGSSGSGKSSLIRAGLIPNLEAGFLVQDRDLWRIAKMKPGDAPLDNLAQVLFATVGHAGMDDLAPLLHAQGAKAALDFLRPALTAADANLLLLVDQFEEIFRYSMNTDDRRRHEEARSFVALLLRLAEQTELPVFVCLTMRSDFLGDCDVFHGLPEAMNRSQYLVPRLTRSQRREAIANPIRLTGAEIAPRLLDRLLNENVDTRDDLPVLQHAMMRTWAEWAKAPNGAIDIFHYEKIGTIQSALSQHANEALAELTAAQQATAKILLQSITETDAGNRRIRRPCHLSEIAVISSAAPETLLEIIQKFREEGRSFLVLSSENLANDPLVDISHESLIRQWETLRTWVDEEAESAKTYRRLAESAALYQKDKTELYREADLEVVLDWRKEKRPNKFWALRYNSEFDNAMSFLQKSEISRNAEIAEKERQRRKDLGIVGIFTAIILLVINGGFFLVAFLTFFESKLTESRLLIVCIALVSNLIYFIFHWIRSQYFKKPSTYFDFEVLIAAKNRGVYPVAVLNSPVGEANSEFDPQSLLLDPKIEQTLGKMKKRLHHHEPDDLLSLGSKFYNMAFPEKIQWLYESALGRLASQQKKLRLKLRIEAPELSGLPWEFLYDYKYQQNFLALSGKTSIVRHIPTIGYGDLEPIQLPLKILVVAYSPVGFPQLDLEREIAVIKKALLRPRLTRSVDLIIKPKATLAEIDRYLQKGVHVLHFIGHCLLDRQSSKRCLVLENENGGVQYVNAEIFGSMFNRSSARLVVLNAGGEAAISDHNEYIGLAPMLIRAGVPAVLEMQFGISDDSAIEFTSVFYRVIMRHFSVDDAVSEARQALMIRGHFKHEWATQALFMRGTTQSILG